MLEHLFRTSKDDNGKVVDLASRISRYLEKFPTPGFTYIRSNPTSIDGRYFVYELTAEDTRQRLLQIVDTKSAKDSINSVEVKFVNKDISRIRTRQTNYEFFESGSTEVLPFLSKFDEVFSKI